MDDRTLLEKAAKAAGLKLGELGGRVVRYESDGQPVWWNPLTDDGDRYRLAIKLRLFSTNRQTLDIWISAFLLEGMEDEQAIGRAIVRAAAAMADKGE